MPLLADSIGLKHTQNALLISPPPQLLPPLILPHICKGTSTNPSDLASKDLSSIHFSPLSSVWNQHSRLTWPEATSCSCLVLLLILALLLSTGKDPAS